MPRFYYDLNLLNFQVRMSRLLTHQFRLLNKNATRRFFSAEPSASAPTGLIPALVYTFGAYFIVSSTADKFIDALNKFSDAFKPPLKDSPEEKEVQRKVELNSMTMGKGMAQ